jgi:hypothetical protein
MLELREAAARAELGLKVADGLAGADDPGLDSGQLGAFGGDL